MSDGGTIIRLAAEQPVSVAEIEAALDVLATIREFLDKLERQFASARTQRAEDAWLVSP